MSKKISSAELNSQAFAYYRNTKTKLSQSMRLSRHLSFGILFTLLLIVILPSAGFAMDEQTTQVGQVLNYGDFISKVWAWATRAIFTIAVLGIVVGGVMFSASNGDEDRADIGRQTIRGSIIGIFIVLLSAIFQNFIQPPLPGDEIAGLRDWNDTLTAAARNFVAVVGAVSAVSLVASSIRLITASADEIKIEKGKNGIKYSILGLVIALSAWTILSFIVKIWQ